MASQSITENTFTANGESFFYLAAGPSDGPLLIFIHGWPGISETWTPQLTAFAALGFRAIAPDTRGYGRSPVSKKASDYALEHHVSDMLALLSHLDQPRAVWIGHDWGCGLVWAFAAHHPEACIGVVNMCVPYRTLELGLDVLVSTVNRDLYPADKYPHGQWNYQHNYEVNQEKTIAALDANPTTSSKVFYLPGDPASYGKISFTASVTESGGFFGGAPEAPDVPLSATLLDDSLHKTLTKYLAQNGWFGPCAYYLNHSANKAYAAKSANNGYLDFPVLFIEARYDIVCSTSLGPKMNEPMRAYCRDLTETSVEAGHWVAMEKPREVNGAVARWLATKLEGSWPGYWSRPFVGTKGKL